VRSIGTFIFFDNPFPPKNFQICFQLFKVVSTFSDEKKLIKKFPKHIFLKIRFFAHGIGTFRFYDNPFPQKNFQNVFQLFQIFSTVSGQKKEIKKFPTFVFENSHFFAWHRHFYVF
jgi:hypothetical protein